MSKLLLLAVLLTSIPMVAQKNQATTLNNESPVFMCKSIIIGENENIVEMTGNVDLQSESLQLKGAEEVIFNTKTNELIVKGWTSFTLAGDVGIQFNEKTKRPTMLRYRLGNQIAYLE